MVPCIHQNEDIIGYSVVYGILGSGHMETKMVTSSDNQTTSLDGLMSNMNYLVQVAGVNAEGVGECRNITVTTPQSESHTHMDTTQ